MPSPGVVDKKLLSAKELAIEDKLTYKGPTLTDVKAIREYTEDGYFELNRHLRNGGEDKAFTTAANKLSAAINKLPDRPGMTFRGIFSPDLREAFELMKKGDVFRDKGFLSTSKDLAKAQEFASGGGVLMFIKGKRGKDIQKFSKYDIESEVLFNKGTKLRARRDPKKVGINLHVYLEEI